MNMVNQNIWTVYEKPPQACVDAVGKIFYHKEYETQVKVTSIQLEVDYVVKEKEEKFGNVPFGRPIIIFEILSGDFSGQILAMVSGSFFRLFSQVH